MPASQTTTSEKDLYTATINVSENAKQQPSITVNITTGAANVSATSLVNETLTRYLAMVRGLRPGDPLVQNVQIALSAKPFGQ